MQKGGNQDLIMKISTALTGNKKGLSSFTIRIVAMVFLVFTLLYETGLGASWMSCSRWISYPIFAFLLQEGIQKTGDQMLYCRRLCLFTVITEFCYNFLMVGRFINYRSRSIMTTLLIAYVCIMIIDFVRKKLDNLVVTLLVTLLMAWLGYLLSARLNSSFYQFGVPMAIVFYIASHISYPKLFEFIIYVALVINLTARSMFTVTVGGLMYEIPVQAFALIALIFIWLYNGERGPNGLAAKISFYLFCPAAMLIIGIIKLIVY